MDAQLCWIRQALNAKLKLSGELINDAEKSEYARLWENNEIRPLENMAHNDIVRYEAIMKRIGKDIAPCIHVTTIGTCVAKSDIARKITAITFQRGWSCGDRLVYAIVSGVSPCSRIY
uniref:Uncharacterized protein n=1 Tax=Parascaris equorum TaxID=6256 RepID=A0A914S6D9_PAREQ